MPQQIDVHGTAQSEAAKWPHPYTLTARPKKAKRRRAPKFKRVASLRSKLSRLERSRLWWREYTAYLKSDQWVALKAKKRAECPAICKGCGANHGVQLHHLVYRKPIWDARLDDLMWLCETCHTAAHQAKKRGHLRFKAGKHSPVIMHVMTLAAVKQARQAA